MTKAQVCKFVRGMLVQKRNWDLALWTSLSWCLQVLKFASWIRNAFVVNAFWQLSGISRKTRLNFISFLVNTAIYGGLRHWEKPSLGGEAVSVPHKAARTAHDIIHCSSSRVTRAHLENCNLGRSLWLLSWTWWRDACWENRSYKG